MTTATALNRAERVVLNTVYDAGDRGVGMNALMGKPDVDYDLVYGLVDGKYLTGPTREDLAAGLLPEHGGAYQFRLTQRGRRWVEGDPMSGLLRDLLSVLRGYLHGDGDRTQARLNRVLARGHDKDTLQMAHEQGFITVHYAGDHRECPYLGAYEFRHAADFEVQITGKARDFAIG